MQKLFAFTSFLQLANNMSSYLPAYSLNTQKSQAAMGSLLLNIAEMDKFIYCIQEPYFNTISGKIPGVPRGVKVIHDHSSRAAMAYSDKLDMWPAPVYTGADIATGMIITNNPNMKEVFITSVYLDIKYKNERFFPEKLIKLIEYCGKERKPLIINVDSNSHSCLWGLETNERGEVMEELIFSKNLRVQNFGSIPTFKCHRGKAISTCIDVTLTLNYDEVENWRISNCDTMSDHNEISYGLDFRIQDTTKEVFLHKKLNVHKFNKDIIARLPNFPKVITPDWLDEAAESLSESIRKSFEDHCPKKKIGNKPPKPHYWNSDITAVRKGVRRAWEKYVKDKSQSKWDHYIANRNLYNNVLKKSKKKSWKKHYTSIATVKETSNLVKSVQQKENRVLGLLKDSSPNAGPENTLNIMTDTHWPGSQDADPNAGNEPKYKIATFMSQLKNDKRLRFISIKKIRWAISKFGPTKAAGPDGIKPHVIQSLYDEVLAHMALLFKASLALEYVPRIWRKSAAVFIPKPGKDTYDIPKAFRPISLTSFIWKTFERVVLIHVEQDFLSQHPLHKNQHAFRKGSSCDSALSDFVNKVEKGIKRGRYVIGVFLDIQGAFDNLDPEAALKGMSDKGIPGKIINWYGHYLRGRTVNIEYKGLKKTRFLTRGTPQGGVFSPLAWNLGFDSLLKLFDDDVVEAIGFADDCALLIEGIDPMTLRSIAIRAMKKAFDWGQSKGLKFGAAKTVVVLFHNSKRNYKKPPKITIDGVDIAFSDAAKYLGIEIDSTLSFKLHIENKVKKAKRLLFLLKNAIGKIHGPKPSLMRWVWTGMVRPMLTYGCVVWQHRTLLKGIQKKLDQLQRLALLLTGHILRSAPTKGLEVITGVPPLNLFCQKMAIKTYLRIKERNDQLWDGLGNTKTKIGHRKILEHLSKEWNVHKIQTEKKPDNLIWNQKYEVNRNSLITGKPTPKSVCCYTDGSKYVGRVGWGFHIKITNETSNDIIVEGFGRLNDEASVFQAEVMAIIKAVTRIRELAPQAEWDFYCDNQGAVKTLDNPEVNTELVAECSRALSELGETANVTLHWIKAHVGYPGNERADTLAKNGTRVKDELMERIPIPRSYLKFILEQTLLEKWNKTWSHYPGLRQTKLWFPEIQAHKSEKLMKLEREEFGKVLQVITGHNYLRYHQNKWDPKIAPECRFCGFKREDAHHIIQDCPTFSKERENATGFTCMVPVTLTSLPEMVRNNIGKYLTVEAVADSA